MVVQMMWFKRDPKPVSEKVLEKENGMVGKLRKKKPSLLKPTRESSERETSTESDRERRRYSDILDMKSSLERRDESDESLYESADGHSDPVSASDDALPRLGKTPTISKESLKLAVTDEEADSKFKKGHRKAMSLSNPLEMVKNLGDEWHLTAKKENDKNSDKKKSRESLWSEEDKESIHGSTTLLDQIRKNSRKEDKSQSSSRKSSNTDAPKARKSSKGSSVGSFNFLRRKKTPTSLKPVEVVPEDVTKILSTFEVLTFTKQFLEEEQRYASIEQTIPVKPPVETDSEDEPPTPRPVTEHRRRLSRQTSRSKSKVRGKSQSLKVNTLRKSHSGTLKKGKKKSMKTPSLGRSRQASIVEQTPLMKKKNSDASKQNSWLFSGSWGESKREGSNEEPTAPDADVDTSDANTKEPDKDNSWRTAPPSGRGVNRAESCRDRERELPRRGKHRNASDPNRLTAHNNHDLEPGAATAPSGSSSSSSLSSRSNESNTVAAEQQASQSDWSEEEEPLAAAWSDTVPAHVLDSLTLSHRLRKRQEVIHELIVSEGSHLRWLKVLGLVFLRPLESQPSLLPPEELRALFPNLPSVRERHAKLYGELRALRTDADAPLVDIRGVADAILNTLGEPGYATCLSKFCRGQRMALDSLRERRRKHKELHQFLSAREQLPLCGRLQLRDLLACVWQRLTKYQLLLEGIYKTVVESDGESEEDISRLQQAVTVAKDVLHCVDTAIRTAENEHRLRTISSKLEARVPSGGGGAAGGGEWEELRRLDLTNKALRMEGELSLKNDNNKKINMLALMLEDSLVLLQREGDKFLLKPISQASQQHLSPLIRWDKVLFRPNAAVKNTFFLMNINGVQMHELSANTAAEYATWVKHIQEAPLAKLTELKPNITPSHHHTRSTDDSGINVSRNPSDASEKSNSTVEDESERDRTSAERSSAERERDGNIEDKTEAQSLDKDEKEDEKLDKDEKHKPRRPTLGRTTVHTLSPPPLQASAAVTVQLPAQAHLALPVTTEQEHLRRLDETISLALHKKLSLVCALLHVPARHQRQVADLAVLDARGDLDISYDSELGGESGEDNSDIQQLLLAAFTQANRLTSVVSASLRVSETAALAARAACRACHAHAHTHTHTHSAHNNTHEVSPLPAELEAEVGEVGGELDSPALALADSDVTAHCDGFDVDELLESTTSVTSLAARVTELSCDVSSALSRAISLAAAARERERTLRERLAAANETIHLLRARHHSTEDEVPLKSGLDPTIQEPSNGG